MIETQLDDAVTAHRAGDLDLAQMRYEAILRTDPHQPDALHLLGLLAQRSGDLARGRELIEAALAVAPRVAQMHYNLGLLCALQNDIAAAIQCYETAAALVPEYAEANAELGNLYLKTGRVDDALRAYRAALQVSPDSATVCCNLGATLIILTRYDEAIEALQVALRLRPDMAEAHANLAQAYRRSSRFRKAIGPARRAIELRPDYRDAYLTLALAACESGDFETALSANQHALEVDATSADVHCNRARVFHLMGRDNEAIAAAETAIALRPDYAEAHLNLAFSLLVCGNFSRGWNEYIWMWRVPATRSSYPYLDRATLWNGDSFQGRELLITREQGLGDAIQMARYLPAVKACGGHVVLEVLPALVSLFEGLPGVDELRVVSDVASFRDDVDLYIPLMSLPRALGTDLASIPAPIPYLRGQNERVERWRPRLESSARLRVGIVWAGNPSHADDRHRSCSLEDLAPLGAIEGIAWFGLQKGREETRCSAGSLELEPLGPDIVDFSDTAAILTCLDLVISVDTSTVHLAGAMGIPVWTLLPFVPDWRWMTGRSDSPWYPTMRLFRQPQPGDWAHVVAEVGNELRAFAARRSAVKRRISSSGTEF